jgi:hypothetical protein
MERGNVGSFLGLAVRSVCIRCAAMCGEDRLDVNVWLREASAFAFSAREACHKTSKSTLFTVLADFCTVRWTRR